MKVNDTITFIHDVFASAGYDVRPVSVKKLTLIDARTEPSASGLSGAPARRYFTFLALEAGEATVQFAKFRWWELSNAIYEDPLVIKVEEAEDMVGAKFGDWQPFEKNVSDVEEVFKGLTGVRYKPLLVTSQIVNGTNFIALTSATLVGSDSVSYSALVRLYKRPETDAKPKIVEIVSLGNPSPSFAGGYTAFRMVEDESKKVSDEALKGFTGSDFDPKYVSTQVVSVGINYRFAGNLTLNTNDEPKPKSPVFLTVYAPFSGDPVIIGIEKVFDLV
jgi:hypothetical protein